MIKNTIKSIVAIFIFVTILSCTETQTSDTKENVEDSLKAEVIKPKDSIDLSKYDRYFNDVARFYAGKKQVEGSTIQSMDTNAAWKKHHEEFTIFYDSIERTWFPPVVKFRSKELYEVNQEIKTLYYPFSGPDFVHANLFFPKAENIIMLGLERVGNVPKLGELSDARMGKFFNAVRTSLDSIFTFGYFMTNDMNKDFSRSLELRGITPILMLFMNKSNYTVLDVQKITIDKKGNLQEITKTSKWIDRAFDTFVAGVRIKYYMPGSDNVRTLYYFSHDVSKKNIVKTPELLTWLNKQEINVTFLKAASYLMGSFNQMREVAVTKSKYLFQTDSGIPLRFLKSDNWDFKFYGKYKRTISVFHWAFQSKMKAIYEKNENITPLEFGIGYGFRYNESNLMLATKKDKNQ